LPYLASVAPPGLARTPYAHRAAPRLNREERRPGLRLPWLGIGHGLQDASDAAGTTESPRVDGGSQCRLGFSLLRLAE